MSSPRCLCSSSRRDSRSHATTCKSTRVRVQCRALGRAKNHISCRSFACAAAIEPFLGYANIYSDILKRRHRCRQIVIRPESERRYIDEFALTITSARLWPVRASPLLFCRSSLRYNAGGGCSSSSSSSRSSVCACCGSRLQPRSYVVFLASERPSLGGRGATRTLRAAVAQRAARRSSRLKPSMSARERISRARGARGAAVDERRCVAVAYGVCDINDTNSPNSLPPYPVPATRTYSSSPTPRAAVTVIG
jgi:hypothetical protein